MLYPPILRYKNSAHGPFPYKKKKHKSENHSLKSCDSPKYFERFFSRFCLFSFMPQFNGKVLENVI